MRSAPGRARDGVSRTIALSKNRYRLLLIAIVLQLVVLSTEMPLPWFELATTGLVVLLAALLLSITGRHRDAWLFAGLSMAAYVVDWSFPWQSAHPIVDLVKVAAWLAASVFLGLRVFTRVFAEQTVGRDEIAGAVAVYLLVAHVFANVFETLLLLDPAAIHFGEHLAGQPIGFDELIYFGFVTLSTLGYGDISPASPVARAVAMIEATIGVLYLAIMIAHFMSMRSFGRSRR